MRGQLVRGVYAVRGSQGEDGTTRTTNDVVSVPISNDAGLACPINAVRLLAAANRMGVLTATGLLLLNTGTINNQGAVRNRHVGVPS